MTNKIAAVTAGLFLLFLVCGCDDERADTPAPPPADTEMKKIEDAFEAVKDKYSRSISSVVGDATEYEEKLIEAQKAGDKKQVWEYRKALAGTMREVAEQKRRMCVEMEEALKDFEKMPEAARKKYSTIHAEMYLEIVLAGATDFLARRAKKASELIQQAAEVDPNFDLEQAALGFASLGWHGETIKLLEIVAQSGSPSNNVNYQLGMSLLAVGRYDEAIEKFKPLVERPGLHPDVIEKIRNDIAICEKAKQAVVLEQEYLKDDEKQNLPRVKLETTRGDIVVELFWEDAPNTVGNFISLVEDGFYNGLLFHRVGGWVVQGGDPLGCGIGGPGYSIKTETVGNRRRHFPGYMGMARGGGKDTEGSQFYFVKYVVPELDEDEYTVFGRIIEGMDVMLNIEEGDKIIEATFINKHEHEDKNFTPETIPE